MNKKAVALLLLLPLVGCGKYAAAALGHPAAPLPRHHDVQQKEKDPHREECQWKKPLFC